MKKMKQMALLLLGGMMATALLTACTDDDDNSNQGSEPGGSTTADMVVDQWAQDITYDVTGSGDWRIETDDRFYTVEPNEGSGPTKVVIYMQRNRRDERRKGTMKVVYTKDASQNKTVNIEQKWKGEYKENEADAYQTMNEVYAVGYSYDCTGEYASPNSVRYEIFDTNKLSKLNKMIIDEAGTDLNTTTASGASISEVSNDLAVKASVSGGFGKFKAEASSSFDMKYAKNENYEFAINYLEVQTATVRINANFNTLLSNYMNGDAYEDINGLTQDYRGADGIRALIRDYGTHVVMNSRLGGRIRQSMAVDISEVKGSYDINAFAKASYGGVFVSGSAEVKDEFKKSYEQNKSSVDIRLSTLGGNTTIGIDLGMQGGFTHENVEKWIESVNGSNSRLIGFGSKALRPLYELVDRAKYPERYEEMKTYMEGVDGKGISKDFDSYSCGTTTRIKVPQFNSDDSNATLVKGIYLGGQKVGIICEEFIPIINMKNRVKVVYPIISNKVRYNLGFFLGDDNHRPGRVSWDGASVVVQEYEDREFGEAKEIYLRGATVMGSASSGLDIKDGDTRDQFLQNRAYWDAGYGLYEVDYSYPQVKLLNNIWTREDYSRQMNDVRQEYSQTEKKYISYFLGSMVKKQPSELTWMPSGWKIATAQAVRDIITMLTTYSVQLPSMALAEGGVTGLNIKWRGWIDNGSLRGGDNQVEHFVTEPDPADSKKMKLYRLRMRRNGPLDMPEGGDNYYMLIRLIED